VLYLAPVLRVSTMMEIKIATIAEISALHAQMFLVIVLTATQGTSLIFRIHLTAILHLPTLQLVQSAILQQ
jgi:hypothetical protein